MQEWGLRCKWDPALIWMKGQLIEHRADVVDVALC